MKPLEAVLRFDDASFRYVDESEQMVSDTAECSDGQGGRVEDVAFSLEPGSCVVLCGKSGHGKSTVLRMAEGLAGSYYPGTSSGAVLVRGTSVLELPDYVRTQTMGVVMQDPRSQFFMGTVADEIAFSLENLGVDPDEVVGRVEEAARLCGVAPLLGSRLTELSSGQKQRVALACAIACRPPLVVMDEPTSNLDEAGSDDLVRILAHLKGLGCAILVSEHRLHRFLPVADEFICLREGRIAARWGAAEFAGLSLEDVASFGLRHPDMRLAQAGDGPAAHGDGLDAAEPERLGGLAAWRLEGMTYLYPATRRGIEGVDAEFPEGAVTILEGPNGSGKTTLARVLCGSLREQGGRVTYNGRPANRTLRRRMSYFVMQDVDYQLYAASVADEVVLGRKVDEALRARAWEALAAFGLTEVADRHPASLSGGQKQRVTMAAAYCSDASLIVLDEPTSGLDGDGVRQVAAWCQTLARQGKAVVVITHDRQLAGLARGTVLRMGPAAVPRPDERSFSRGFRT